MPRPARPWFRFYVEAMRDPKMRRLTPSQRWLWVAVLSAARESCHPGYLMVAEDEPYSCRDLADYAGMKFREVTEGVDQMVKLGMVAVAMKEVMFVPHWDDRQFESDDVTTRVQRSRERRSNVSVTPVVTPPETEAETDEIPLTPLADFEPPLEPPKAENGNVADREREVQAIHAQRLAVVQAAKAKARSSA